MFKNFFSLFRLHSPSIPVKNILASVLGIFVSIVIIILIRENFNFPAIYAPIGATAFLVFAAPSALYSQPANVIFGNAISVLISFIFIYLHLDALILIAFATALASFLMLYFRVPHPPAVGIPLMSLIYKPDPYFISASVICASIILVFIGIIYHRLLKAEYPIRIRNTRL